MDTENSSRSAFIGHQIHERSPSPHHCEHPAYQLELHRIQHDSKRFPFLDFTLIIRFHLLIPNDGRLGGLRQVSLQLPRPHVADPRLSPDAGARSMLERRNPQVAGVLAGRFKSFEVVRTNDGGDGVHAPDSLDAEQQAVVGRQFGRGLDDRVHFRLDSVDFLVEHLLDSRAANISPVRLPPFHLREDGFMLGALLDKAFALVGQLAELQHGAAGELAEDQLFPLVVRVGGDALGVHLVVFSPELLPRVLQDERHEGAIVDPGFLQEQTQVEAVSARMLHAYDHRGGGHAFGLEPAQQFPVALFRVGDFPVIRLVRMFLALVVNHDIQRFFGDVNPDKPFLFHIFARILLVNHRLNPLNPLLGHRPTILLGTVQPKGKGGLVPRIGLLPR